VRLFSLPVQISYRVQIVLPQCRGGPKLEKYGVGITESDVGRHLILNFSMSARPRERALRHLSKLTSSWVRDLYFFYDCKF
jgi:hypothetical protein